MVHNTTQSTLLLTYNDLANIYANYKSAHALENYILMMKLSIYLKL